jgi:hypothetical protein
MGTNSKVCFLGGIKGRSLVVSQGRKVRFIFLIQGILFFLLVWDGVVFFWSFFLGDMVS